MKRFYALIDSIILYTVLLVSCSPHIPSNAEVSGKEATISPDYSDVVIPSNIAPLNFNIEGEGQRFFTTVQSSGGASIAVNGRKVKMSVRKWHRLLETSKGGNVEFRIYKKNGKTWTAFKPIRISVASDPVDEYVSYRLIDPTYGMAGEMKISQRHLSDFREKDIYSSMLDYDRKSGQCINCHSFQAYSTSNYQFHVRQKDGGTIIVHKGNILKVNLKRDGILSAGVYPSWHPSEDLIAYSVNSTYQNFFSTGAHKTEVIDNLSDIIIYDVTSDQVTPILADSLQMETFPYWSPDGKTLYFCQASLEGIEKGAGGRITNDFDKIHYDLMKMDFDPVSRSFSEPELLFNASSTGRSSTLPRPSPDGRYLLFTMGEFGNFHIWHKESDLYLMDLDSGEAGRMENINSEDTESYHSWSSNGRWIVFSSRRDDGLYTRLYLAYFDINGQVHKPFVIPQKNPDRGLHLFKSFNIPEFTREPVEQSPKEFLRIIKGKR